MGNTISWSLEPVQGAGGWEQAHCFVMFFKLELGFAHFSSPNSIVSVGVKQFTSEHLKSILKPSFYAEELRGDVRLRMKEAPSVL